MNPILYRYKDTEAVIKVMDGYTPGDGWEPLYSQDQISSAVNAALEATAPAWNNVPTCEGLWLCDEGDENPYRFTCHDISMPLNPHLVGEGERWYGPIPENTQ